MNKRLALVVLFAFVISAVASLLIYRAVSARLVASAPVAKTQILVATHDLTLGALLKDIDVRFIDWSGKVPEHAIQTKEQALDRGVISNIYSGEPILNTRLAPKGAGAGLAATIPVGMRAVAVRVNEVVGVSGFAVPGMRVDILILGSPVQGASRQETMSKTLLQNIEILSAGQQIQKDTEGKPVQVQVVNVLVTPEQAEILSLASSDARIQLILRNPLDNKETVTPGSHLAQLFSGSAPQQASLQPVRERPRKPVPPPKPAAAPAKKEEKTPPLVVEVIHGSKGGARKTESKFEQQAPEVK